MRKARLCLTATVAAFVSCLSQAQESGGTQATQAASDNSPGQPTDIVITAQKRTERLQDVPVTASVINENALAQSNVSDVSDLNKLVPAVNINGTISGRAPMGIRGIASVSNQQAVGVPSGVALMVDGVPIPPDSYDGNIIEDMQSVEVLEGPQATLGGRTAAAGVINYRTYDPTATFQGGASATATTDSEYRGSAHISGPIAQGLEYSLSAYDAQRYYPLINDATGLKTSQKNWGVRGKLLWDISDTISAKLSYHHADSNVYGANFVYVYATPGADLLATPSPLTQQLLLPNITPSYSNLHYNTPRPDDGHHHEDNDAQLDLSFKLGEYTLTSTTALQHESQRQYQDLFQTAVYFFDTLVTGSPVYSNPQIYNDLQAQSETIQQWSEEIKLVSPSDKPLSFVSGLFFSDTNVNEGYYRPLPVAEELLNVIPDTATYDIYGRLTWKATQAFSVLVGLRYNYDVLKYKYDEQAYALSPTVAFGPYYSTSNSHYCTAGAGSAPSTVANYSFSGCSSQALVGDVSLQYSFSSDLMAYLTYARGYSPEVYNTAATLTSNAPLEPVGQEHINHFELGAKGSFFDRHLVLSGDVFDTIYTNFQIQQFTVIPGAVNPLLNLQAAGKAETRGAELNATWRATGYTTLSANAAYVNAVFRDYPGAACEPDAVPGVIPSNCTTESDGTVVQNMSGQPMPNSPKWKVFVDAQQLIPMQGGIEAVLDANWAYRTATEMMPDNNPNGIMPGFGLLNLSAGIQSTDGRWSIIAFCNNVFNRVYYQDVEDFWSSPWSGSSMVIGEPARDAQRYGGLRANVNF